MSLIPTLKLTQEVTPGKVVDPAQQQVNRLVQNAVNQISTLVDANTTTAINYTLQPADATLFVTADNLTIQFPTCVGVPGKEYTVIQTAGYKVLLLSAMPSQLFSVHGVTGNTYTLDGSAFVPGTPFSAVTFVSDGIKTWRIKSFA